MKYIMENKKNRNSEKIINDKLGSKNFIPSYFGWITMTEQKKRVERLENLTNDSDEKVKGESNDI